MADGFISKQLCACGCDTYMTQATVDRGWQYIRGHKPRASGAVPTHITDRKVALAAKAFGYADAVTLAEAEIATLQGQRLEVIAQRDKAIAAVAMLEDRLELAKLLRHSARRMQGLPAAPEIVE